MTLATTGGVVDVFLEVPLASPAAAGLGGAGVNVAMNGINQLIEQLRGRNEIIDQLIEDIQGRTTGEQEKIVAGEPEKETE